jgi:hypothetical protein
LLRVHLLHPLMNPIRRLARLLLFLTLSTLTHAAELPRVAVVPDSPEPSVAAFADFLSVSLASASSQYTLVERAELTRLASELEVQKLAADQRPAALAKLAKADGLIIVGVDKGDPDLPKLTLRLTSTNNGLVIRSLILGGKEDEYAKVAELAAGVLCFPCERLTNCDTKPPIVISLLGIRPAFEIDRTLETTLNLAVAQQLSAQSGIAVSERWKMNDLVFEHSLADEKSQPFATGTVLLDGSYTRKGDQLEFSLRLRKAEAETGKTLALQGPLNKPAELAQQIAKLVATESGQSGEAVAWNALEEGKKYSELGGWLHQRKQGKESAQAYESALALGFVDQNLPRERVRAYQGILDNDIDSIFFDRVWINQWLKLPAQEFRQKLMTAIRTTQVTIEALDSNWSGISPQDFDPSRSKNIITKSFDIDMKMLQCVCLRKAQIELATEARTLRALARELVAKSESVSENYAGELVQRFYMHDTPTEAAADLRRLLMPEKMTNEHWSRGYWLRCNFWKTYQFSNLLRFVDWDSTDNRKGDEAWRNFVHELQDSNSLQLRADGFALAFQTSKDLRDQETSLQSYCDLLEHNWDEFLTPNGQMILKSFCYYFNGSSDDASRKPYPAFNLRMTQIFTRIFESGKWAEPATLVMASWLTRDWAELASRGKPIVPEVTALALLNAAENYIKWAQTDPRWEQQYRSRDYGNVGKYLEALPESIILGYPNIKSHRIKERPVVAGAVDIRTWSPGFENASAKGIALSSFHWVTCGGSLLVVTGKDGIIDLNVRSMAVSRVIKFPLQDGEMVNCITSNKDTLMISMDDRLFITPLTGDGNSWKEIDIPGVKEKNELGWQIYGLGSDFFVGTKMRDNYGPVSDPKMLIGTVHEGRLDWQVSSNRRPALHPLDETLPRNTRIAYQNAAGKTMVLLEQRFERTTLTELETGREICDLLPSGMAQTRGELPIYWFGYKETIQLIAVLDPSKEQPRLLCKPTLPHLNFPETWNDVRPLYDNGRPEFLGTPVGVICHDGKIWLLKREADVVGQTEKNDPQAFRLVRMDLNGGEPVVIPLRYEVPESVRALWKVQPPENRCDLERPIIESHSLIATTIGFFFAPETDSHLTPNLFYITWDDINAWLAKNALEPAKPASP